MHSSYVRSRNNGLTKKETILSGCSNVPIFFLKRSEYAPVTTFHVGKKIYCHPKIEMGSKFCEIRLEDFGDTF